MLRDHEIELLDLYAQIPRPVLLDMRKQAYRSPFDDYSDPSPTMIAFYEGRRQFMARIDRAVELAAQGLSRADLEAQFEDSPYNEEHSDARY